MLSDGHGLSARAFPSSSCASHLGAAAKASGPVLLLEGSRPTQNHAGPELCLTRGPAGVASPPLRFCTESRSSPPAPRPPQRQMTGGAVSLETGTAGRPWDCPKSGREALRCCGLMEIHVNMINCTHSSPLPPNPIKYQKRDKKMSTHKSKENMKSVRARGVS